FSEEHKTLKDLAMNCFPLMEHIQTMPKASTSQVYQLFLLHFPDAQKIPYKYAEALILTDIKGLSQQELADKLGISLSGAKSRVQRGREKLKEMLMECCIFEFDARGQVVNYEPKKNACETCAKA
ncbi:MAG: sigma factor-like helix-turn-helix DNA-binding protein, partial [Bacteroidia bacterium]